MKKKQIFWVLLCHVNICVYLKYLKLFFRQTANFKGFLCQEEPLSFYNQLQKLPPKDWNSGADRPHQFQVKKVFGEKKYQMEKVIGQVVVSRWQVACGPTAYQPPSGSGGGE